MTEIKVTVQKITKEATGKVRGFGLHNARSGKIISYQATATYGKLTTTGFICDSRKKAIESVTRGINSLINSALSQGLEIE